MTVENDLAVHIADETVHYLEADIRITVSQVTDFYNDLDPWLVPESNIGQANDNNKVLMAGTTNGTQYWNFVSHEHIVNNGLYSHDSIDIHLNNAGIHLPSAIAADENKYLRAHIAGNVWENITHEDVLNIGVNDHDTIDQFIVDTGLTLKVKLDLFKQLNEPPTSKSGDIWQAAIGEVVKDPAGDPYITYGIGYNVRTLSSATDSISLFKAYRPSRYSLLRLENNGAGHTFPVDTKNYQVSLLWVHDGLTAYSAVIESGTNSVNKTLIWYKHTYDVPYDVGSLNNSTIKATTTIVGSENVFITSTTLNFSPNGDYIISYGPILFTLSLSVPFDLTSTITFINIANSNSNLNYMIEGLNNTFISGFYGTTDIVTTFSMQSPIDGTSLAEISSSSGGTLITKIKSISPEPIKTEAASILGSFLDATGDYLYLNLKMNAGFPHRLAKYKLSNTLIVDDNSIMEFVEDNTFPGNVDNYSYINWSPNGAYLYASQTSDGFVQMEAHSLADPIADGFFMSPDGLSLFTGHYSAQYIYKQDITVAFEIGTTQPEYIEEFDVSTEIAFRNIIGVHFFDNGNTFWVITSDKNIYQYNCITPYILTGAVYQTVQFINGVVGDISSIGFSLPGTRAYALTSAGLYAFSIAISGDANTLSKLHFIDIGELEYNYDITAKHGVVVDDIGNALFIVSTGTGLDTDGIIVEYRIQDYEIYTLSYVTKAAIREMVKPHFAIWSADGTKLYIKGSDDVIIFQYISGEVILNEPIPHEGYDTESLVEDYRDTSVSGEGTGAAIPWIGKDGLRMFYFERATLINRVFQRNLERYWDVSSSTLEIWKDVDATLDDPWGIWVNKVGSILYIFDSLGGRSWDFAVNFDILTISSTPDVVVNNLWIGGEKVSNVTVMRDGYNIYAIPNLAIGSSHEVYWATSATPDDITSITHINSTPFIAYLPDEGYASATANTFGDKFFIAHDNLIHEFDLGTLFDPSSAVWVRTTALNVDLIIYNIHWSDTGHKLYVYDDTAKLISQYSSMGTLEATHGHNLLISVEY